MSVIVLYWILLPPEHFIEKKISVLYFCFLLPKFLADASYLPIHPTHSTLFSLKQQKSRGLATPESPTSQTLMLIPDSSALDLYFSVNRTCP